MPGGWGRLAPSLKRGLAALLAPAEDTRRAFSAASTPSQVSGGGSTPAALLARVRDARASVEATHRRLQETASQVGEALPPADREALEAQLRAISQEAERLCRAEQRLLAQQEAARARREAAAARYRAAQAEAQAAEVLTGLAADLDGLDNVEGLEHLDADLERIEAEAERMRARADALRSVASGE